MWPWTRGGFALRRDQGAALDLQGAAGPLTPFCGMLGFTYWLARAWGF